MGHQGTAPRDGFSKAVSKTLISHAEPVSHSDGRREKSGHDGTRVNRPNCHAIH